jgi:CHAD domain-containing protein/predicted phosphodiesterase
VRIAVLGCIHANLTALEAVLADAHAQRADRIVCAGDVVGWGPQPRETLAALQARGIPSIRGHDDRRVVDLALDRDRGDGARGPLTVRWTLERLDDESLRALAGFPLSYGFATSGRTVVLVHGTPRDEDEVLPPDAPARRLEAFLLLAGADVLACAHGHRPFVRELEGGRLVVNAGSVGRSFDGDPRASWVLVELDPKGPCKAEVRRVAYDVRQALEAAEAAGSPRRVRDELAARREAAERAEPGCKLVVTAPFRGGRSLRRLARDAVRDPAKLLRRATDERDDPVAATHDTRVATRRILAALDLFGELFPPREVARVERVLKGIRRRLGHVRDADVALELLESLPGEGPKSLGEVVAHDAAIKAREEAAPDRERGLDLAAERSLHDALEALVRAGSRGSVRSVGDRLSEIAARARIALDEALVPESGSASLHAFRVAAKRLRYALEALAPIDPAAAALGASLAEVQDEVGDARDRASLALHLDQEAARLAAEGRAALAEAVRALAARFREDALEREAAFRAAGPGAEALAALSIGSSARSEPSAAVD